jgi:hypothetical protein
VLNRIAVVAALLLVSLLPAGCTWVELNAQAKEVTLIDAAAAGQCQLLGVADSMSADHIGVLNRKKSKVALELLTLAQNSAADMGGNAVSEMAPMAAGKQSFNVYLCPE